MYCPYCGVANDSFNIYCTSCGVKLPELAADSAAAHDVPHAPHPGEDGLPAPSYCAPRGYGRKACKKWVAFFLCLFLGPLGLHKYYEGNILLGILFTLTLGFFGIGSFISLCIIVQKPDIYYV